MAAAIPIAAAAVQAGGSLVQGQSTAAYLGMQADLQQNNAAEALAQGQFDAMREGMVATQKIGEATAAYGASGVSTNAGSALSVVQESAANAELDKLNILHGAQVRAINYQNQAAMDRYGGQAAIQGSYWRALGSMAMGGAESYARMPSSPGTGEAATVPNTDSPI